MGLGHQGEQGQEGLVVGEGVALVVHDGHVLAAGVEHRPEVGARGPHQVADTRAALAWRSKVVAPAVLA